MLLSLHHLEMLSLSPVKQPFEIRCMLSDKLDQDWPKLAIKSFQSNFLKMKCVI